MPTVNYFRIVGWERDAVKRAERNEGYRKGHEAAWEIYVWRPTYITMSQKEPPKITNSTSTDITFGGA